MSREMFLTMAAGPASHSSPSSAPPKVMPLASTDACTQRSATSTRPLGRARAARCVRRCRARPIRACGLRGSRALRRASTARWARCDARLRGWRRSLAFGDGLSQGASFKSADSTTCWGVGSRRSRTPEPPLGVADPRRRKASKKDFSIAFSADSRVENRDDAAILSGANQASKALFQRKRGRRDEVSHERGLAGLVEAFAARGHDRVARNVEGELVDDDEPQGRTGDVDALPEARGREQHGVALVAKSIEQGLLRRVTLNEPLVVELLSDTFGKNRIMRSEVERTNAPPSDIRMSSRISLTAASGKSDARGSGRCVGA